MRRILLCVAAARRLPLEPRGAVPGEQAAGAGGARRSGRAGAQRRRRRPGDDAHRARGRPPRRRRSSVQFALCREITGTPSADPALSRATRASSCPMRARSSARLDLLDPAIVAFAGEAQLDGGAFDAGGGIAEALDQGVPLLIGFTARTGSRAPRRLLHGDPALGCARTRGRESGAHRSADRRRRPVAAKRGRAAPARLTAPKDDPSKKYGFSFFATAGDISSLRSTDTTATGQSAETWVEWTAPPTRADGPLLGRAPRRPRRHRLAGESRRRSTDERASARGVCSPLAMRIVPRGGSEWTERARCRSAAQGSRPPAGRSSPREHRRRAARADHGSRARPGVRSHRPLLGAVGRRSPGVRSHARGPAARRGPDGAGGLDVRRGHGLRARLPGGLLPLWLVPLDPQAPPRAGALRLHPLRSPAHRADLAADQAAAAAGPAGARRAQRRSRDHGAARASRRRAGSARRCAGRRHGSATWSASWRRTSIWSSPAPTRDADAFREMGARRVRVVPNAIPPLSPALVAQRHDVVFVGSLDWRPNADAAVIARERRSGPAAGRSCRERGW